MLAWRLPTNSWRALEQPRSSTAGAAATETDWLFDFDLRLIWVGWISHTEACVSGPDAGNHTSSGHTSSVDQSPATKPINMLQGRDPLVLLMGR